MKTLLNYLLIAFKAVAKFLKYAYASQITIGALAVFVYLFHSKFFGVLLFAWGLLLFINELKQQK
jgi:hypothetical protein